MHSCPCCRRLNFGRWSRHERYLIAIAKDGKDALVGCMGKRDDGKFCIERVVTAKIENNALRDYEFWYVDAVDKQRQAQWLDEVIRAHLDGFQWDRVR